MSAHVTSEQEALPTAHAQGSWGEDRLEEDFERKLGTDKRSHSHLKVPPPCHPLCRKRVQLELRASQTSVNWAHPQSFQGSGSGVQPEQLHF